jgi:colanic acid/amylovoran biosynthesis protein
MKTCILGATFETGNMGVSSLTEGTIRALLQYYPSSNITLLNYGMRNDEMDFNYDGQLVKLTKTNMRFSKRFYLKNNIARLLAVAIMARLIPIKKYKEKLIARNYYLKTVAGADIVASIAGGDSFSDIYGLRRFLYVALPQVLSIILGKKVFQLPQTFGPFNKKLTQVIAKYILTNSCPIYSRDHQGVIKVKELLKNNKNTDDKVKFSYDVGFIVEPTPSIRIPVDFFPRIKEKTLLVGLNVSGLLYIGGYSKNNMFNIKIDYRSFIHELIELLINKWKVKVILVPHVFGDYDPNSETDQTACEQIFESLKAKYDNKLIYLKGRYDHREIKYIIGNCDVFMGSRMHACIAAISQNIPTVPIAYSQKFIGVMQTVGIEPYVVDLTKMDSEEIDQVIELAWESKEETRRKLEAKMPQVKNDVHKLFENMLSDTSPGKSHV